MIVSSEKNLTGFVEGGLFNEDLYRAIAKLSLSLAPLRERAEDVAAAVLVIASRYGHELGVERLPRFDKEAIEALQCFPWPQNLSGDCDHHNPVQQVDHLRPGRKYPIW